MPEPGRRDAVLLTRPEPEASATAVRVAALGFRPVIAPMLAIEPLTADLPSPTEVQAVLITSGHALSGLSEEWHGKRLLAVGDATARRARAAGFVRVESASGDAEALARLAAATCDPAGPPLFLASGADQGAALADALSSRSFIVLHREVYAARPAKALPDPAHAALLGGRLRAALFFSAETARIFIRLVNGTGLGALVGEVEAVAIGGQAGMALEDLPWRAIRIAARPNQDEMLALLP